MRALFRRVVYTAALLLVPMPLLAEDIDLFVNAEASSSAPNVLFVIDNAADFSSTSPIDCYIDGVESKLSGTVGGIEQCALHQVIKELPADSVNIGIMVYNDSKVLDFENKPCRGTAKDKPGGCLVYPMALLTESNKAVLLAWIKSWVNDAKDGKDGMIKSAQSTTGATMQEAWAYYFGKMGISRTDYASLKPEEACNNYIIFIGNSATTSGQPKDPFKKSDGPMYALEGTNSGAGALMNADPRATEAQKDLVTGRFPSSCTFGSDLIGIDKHEDSGFYADEWSRYLNAQGVITYTIGVLTDKCNASYPALMTSMANVGGGKYFPTTDLDELVVAIKTALSEMLAVNSVFASVSLPISVNTEGTYLNQVYIGMFRPDQYTRPRWVGNLKQYRLGRVPPRDFSKTPPTSGGPIKLVDAQEPYQEAISRAGTGFLGACALSFWNSPGVNSYWRPADSTGYWPFPYPKNCAENPADSDYKDGPVVEKGGQGYNLRVNTADVGKPPASPDTRNLKACNADCDSTLADFATTNLAITNLSLGATTVPERALLINWARGANNAGDEAFFFEDGTAVVAADEMRPSVHGDVVHSRPVAIDYADTGEEPEVIVFYGANDGVLRAVNGNRIAELTDSEVDAGHEIWGFIAPEFYRHIKRLRDNNPNIAIRAKEGETDRRPKPYGFDGAITAFVDKAEAKRWIFATMRRGGRMIYAFDVSDLNTDPDSPTLLWRFGCGVDGTCTTGASDAADSMGQSWSAPKVLYTDGYRDETDSSKRKPMVIFGGGYDPCEDQDPHACSSTAQGSAVYVLDAESGKLLTKLPTDRPVAADVFVVPDGDTGKAKLAYAVDLGGNVYRISGSTAKEFGVAKPDGDEWTIRKIASLGCATVATCVANRKFMNAPDVVLDSRPDGYVLVLGSGDREKPLHRNLSWNPETEEYEGVGYPSAYATSNYFFMLRDYPNNDSWLTDESSRCGASLLCLASLTPVAVDDLSTPEEPAEPKGWYLAMRTGEQVVTSAITVFGVATFSTHTPTDPRDRAACVSDLGTARVYNTKYANAAPAKPGATNRSEVVVGGGLPPSPVAGKVKLDDDGGPDGGETAFFIIGADPSSSLEGGEPVQPPLSGLPKSINYWYIKK